MKNYDCGIDLGTTNSCIAKANADGSREVIKNVDMMDVTPSAVWISKYGKITVGQKACNSPQKDRVRREFKRDMGTDVNYEFAGSGKVMTPVELSAEVLKKLRADAVQHLGKEVVDAVITVPAAFHELQREATKEAARLAGFREVVLLQEPVAASIAYGAKPGAEDEYWLVYDYGGGTLDCAVVSTRDHELTVVNSCGDNHMGGKDIDRAVYEKIILPSLRKEYSISKDLGMVSRMKAMDAVEEVKISLSQSDTASYELIEAVDDNEEEIEFSMEITRDMFDDAIREIVEDTVDVASESLIGAKIRPSDLNKIVLVGGSTHIPLVRRLLGETFHTKLDTSLNPMTVVAEGAAMYAAVNSVQSGTGNEEVEGAPDGRSASVILRYEDMALTETVTVAGSFVDYKPGTVFEVSFSSEEEGLWEGGWEELLDEEEGVFSCEVYLYNQPGENHYCLHARNKRGDVVDIGSPKITIKYGGGLRLAAPPLPFNIGVRAEDDKGAVVDWLITKNTRLPTQARKTYCLNKSLNPRIRDTFSLVIYEGMDKYNPNANAVIGEACVNSLDLTRVLPKGTEVEICISVNISCETDVTAYIPDYDMLLTQEKLMGGTRYKNMSKEIGKMKDDLKEAEEKLVRLSNAGIDVSQERTHMNQIKRKLSEAGEGQMENDDMELMVKEFRNVESDIIRKERDNSGKIRNDEVEEKIRYCKESIVEFGTKRDIKDFAILEEKYRCIEDKSVKEFLVGKMKDMQIGVLYANPRWLQLRLRYLINEHPAFSNEQKAVYWKKAGTEALTRDDEGGISQAVQNLENIAIWDADSAGSPRIEADIHI